MEYDDADPAGWLAARRSEAQAAENESGEV